MSEKDGAGGVGIDEEQYTSDWKLVPIDKRSGYREGDSLVHSQFWLLLGHDRLLFDPTAHQFDARGGVSIERYILDGHPSARAEKRNHGRA